MRLTYDPEADILGLWLVEGPWGPVTHQEALPGVWLTGDAHQKPLALEVWDASQVVDLSVLSALPLPQAVEGPSHVSFLSLAEAAQRCGLSAGTLKLQAQAGKLGAVKIGRNWAVSEAALARYLQSTSRKAKAQQASERAETP